MEWFTGKTAVVTGAARGIGRSTAELLDELGARVIAVDIDGAALDEAFAHGGIKPLVADMAGDGAALAARLLSEHGTIQLLVNNVGIETSHAFLELGEDDFDRVFATNLRGPWFLTRGLVRRMVDEDRRGAIVFVSSLHDTFVRTFPHYSASKAAVSMLVKELAAELGPHGIRVNAVSPGVVQSGHVPAPGESERRRLQALIPLGGMGQPHQVARVIAIQLCDEWSSYMTGANVRVDGGLGVHSWSLDPDASGS